MNRFLRNPLFVMVFRVILGLIFSIAGFIKIQDPQSFADDIAGFQVLPKSLINLFALSLPPFEVLIGLALILNWKKSTAALGALFLSVIFTLALAQALVRGLPVDCGCFGSGTPSILRSWFSLGRDIILIIGSAILYREVIKSAAA